MVINLILCLPFLRLKTSAATVMPSCMPVPTRASAPDIGTSTPTANSSAVAMRAVRSKVHASAPSAAAATWFFIIVDSPSLVGYQRC